MRLLFIKVEFVSDTSDAVESWIQANHIRSVYDSPSGGCKVTYNDGFTIKINEKASSFMKRLQHIHPNDIKLVDQ